MDTPNIGLHTPVYNAPHWDTAMNQNWALLDLLLSGKQALPGLSVASTFAGVPAAYGHRLCIYYGTPQGVNALWVTESAAQSPSAYDYVVLGDGLEDPSDTNYATTC